MWPFYIEKHRQEACIEEINAAVTTSGFGLDVSYFPTKAVKSAIADSFYRFLDSFRREFYMRPVYARPGPNHEKRNHAFRNLMQLKKKGLNCTIDVLVKDRNEIIHPPHLRQECISECDDYPVSIGSYFLVGLSHDCDYKLKCAEWLDEVQHYAEDFLAKEESIDLESRNWRSGENCRDYVNQYKLWKACEPMECPECYEGKIYRNDNLQGENNGQPRNYDYDVCEVCRGTGILSDRTQIESYHLRKLENIAKKLTTLSEPPAKNFGVYVKFNIKD